MHKLLTATVLFSLLSVSSPLSPSLKPLKLGLAREYATFFEPFRSEFYDEDVTFTDPMVRGS